MMRGLEDVVNRTTLMLPAELKAQAQQRARQLGISLGQLIRQALESELAESGGVGHAEDPLFTDDAVWTGEAPTDLAADHDRYLYDEPGR